MLELFRHYRSVISDGVVKFIDEFKSNVRGIMSSKWYYDAIDKILLFSTGGKMIRGGLLLFTEEMFKGNYSRDGIYLAVALELLQCALLIHDDIMDRDTLRRGYKTIFFQYKEFGDREGIRDSYHFGESMGMCVGDIVFDMAFSAVGYISDYSIIGQIVKKIGIEMSVVGVGQMEDVYLSSTDYIPSEEEILDVYRMKTSRYSFSLPFSIGAILSGIDSSIINLLESLGEDLGIIFQLQDDEIGLFGNKDKIGKPLGSDIKENKKTLFFVYLMKFATDEEKRELLKIFGNKSLDERSIKTVLDLIGKYEIRNLILKRKEDFANKAKEKVLLLPVENKYKDKLFELIDYNLSRSE